VLLRFSSNLGSFVSGSSEKCELRRKVPTYIVNRDAETISVMPLTERTICHVHDYVNFAIDYPNAW
jgi:hypothetical protein